MKQESCPARAVEEGIRSVLVMSARVACLHEGKVMTAFGCRRWLRARRPKKRKPRARLMQQATAMHGQPRAR